MEINIDCSYEEMINISKCKPHPKNNNRHSKEQINRLAQIIDYQGFRSPIVISLLSGFVVKGHGRLLAAKKLGMKKVPVDFQKYEDESQEYADLTADNEIARWAELDMDSIINNADLLSGIDIDMLGIKDLEIPDLDLTIIEKKNHREMVENNEKNDLDDIIPEETDSPRVITKKGDIWILGNHRIMCGDSTNIDDVKKLMNGKKSDMINTDPPYNISYTGGSKKRDAIANDSLDDFNGFLSSIYENYFITSKDGASIYVWHASTETHNFINEFIKSGFLFKSYIIWNKNNSTFGRSDYHWKHEPCIYGWNGKGAHKWSGDRKQTTVWDIDRPSRSDSHPTMKPVELCEKSIINSSVNGDIVCDLFLGSGSTLIACEKLNRKCYGMELDEKYCDVIIKRWESYTGKKAILAK